VRAAGGAAGALDRLRREHAAGALADAYLLIGPARRRVRELAREAAALLLGVDPERVDGHPECVRLDPEELGVQGLKVEHIALRQESVPSLEAALRFRPTDLAGGLRVVLLLDADRMNPDAQAALLKTAEEPPPGTVLLLTACGLGPILPAVRSRCRVVRLGVRPAALLEAEASARGLQGRAWEWLVAATGSPEAALELPEEVQAELLEAGEAFHAWLEGGLEGPPVWLETPEGGNLAEQREALGRRLAAACGWAARAYLQAGPGLALEIDLLLRDLASAQADLRGQVHPRLLSEDLERRLRRRVRNRAPGSV